MKVSVILPVYNVAPYLGQCLDSILRQTFKDIEIICVDDGSTDGSCRIIEEYAKKDRRIRAVHMENAGGGAARNKGIEWASGEYLCFCDPDDYVDASILRKLYDAASKNDADISLCRWTRFDDATGRDEPPFRFPGIVQKFIDARKTAVMPSEVGDVLFTMAGYSPWSKMFRRKFIEGKKLRFQEIRRTNDMFFVTSSLANANKIAFVDESLYHYRIGIKSTTAKDSLAASFCIALEGLKVRLMGDGLYETFKKCYLPLVMTSFINNVTTSYDPVVLHELYPKMRDTVLGLLADDGLGDGRMVSGLMKQVYEALKASDDPLAVVMILFQDQRARIVDLRRKLQAAGTAKPAEAKTPAREPARRSFWGKVAARLASCCGDGETSPKNKRTRFRILSGLIVLLLAIGFAASRESVRSSFAAAGSWREFVAAVHAKLPDEIWGKTKWIDGNGLFMRLMGRRLSNNTLKYRGGLLGNPLHGALKVNELASHIVQWDSLVKSWGGRYMFILAPCKLDRALEILPPGCDPKKQNRYESIDRLHDLLSKKGVQMLDLSYDLAGNLEAVSRNFYHTDHHWRYEAAFEKFPEIARKIAALAGHELPEDLPQFNIENWQAISFENDFLGSEGRRTGAGFAGKDDFTYFIPKFETDIDFWFWTKPLTHRRGPFHVSVLKQNRTVRDLDPHEKSRYAVYIGGESAPISIRSKLAPCKMRLMVLKDSFALPMLGYLSTVFSHIEVLDPRGYSDSNVEFVKAFKPDVTVSLVYMGALTSAKFVAFNTAKTADSVVSSASLGTISKVKATTKHGNTRAQCSLKPGAKYRLQTGVVEFPGDDDSYVADVCLYDAAKKKQIATHSFHAGFSRSEWRFTVPPDVQTPQLLFYAGRIGECLGKSVVYNDVVLDELKGGK